MIPTNPNPPRIGEESMAKYPNREKRKAVKLPNGHLYFRSRKEYKAGEILSSPQKFKSGTNVKSSISRDESYDENNKKWNEKYGTNALRYLQENEVVYEVELKVVRKYRSKDLQEIPDGSARAPILPDETEKESWEDI